MQYLHRRIKQAVTSRAAPAMPQMRTERERIHPQKFWRSKLLPGWGKLGGIMRRMFGLGLCQSSSVWQFNSS